VHGTALKMYVHEKAGKNPEEFPLRFLPFVNDCKVFNDPDGDGVQLCYAISEQQVGAFKEIFEEFPADRVVVSPNGINQKVFHPIEGATIQSVLSTYGHKPYEGSSRTGISIDAGKYDHLVIMVSKFASWKRVPALLYAASSYEKTFPNTATIIVGTGPLDAQKELQDLAYEELGLENTFFLGPQPHPVLAELYSVASVGCFPSYKEPFGLVFIEAASCGCPVIGANSGGPKDFVTDAIGVLVEETDDIKELGKRVESAVTDAITLNWRKTKSEACMKLVAEKYSVLKQCKELLVFTRNFLNI
jgi:glycosyltransferase involved in cell wall biosynthesis